MTYFGQITEGDFEGISCLVQDEREIFIESNEDNLPEEGYEFLPIYHYMFNKNIYCINWQDKEYCGINTFRLPVLYYYGAGEFDIPLSACRKLEYTSGTLAKLMCAYKTGGVDDQIYIDDTFKTGDITVRFSGDKIYSFQQNVDYNTFNPAIILEFEKELEAEQIWSYVQAIDDFLRVVFFEKRIDLPTVRLVEDDDEQIIFHVVESNAYTRSGYFTFYNQYNIIKEYIPDIFTYVFKKRVKCDFFEHYFNSSNLLALFNTTYNIFDELSNETYGSIEENDDFENFKKKIWQTIENDDDYEKIKDNIGNLKSLIMQFGRKVGHKQKLKLAFSDVLKKIPRRAQEYGLYDEKIPNEIYKIRTSIVHKGEAVIFKGYNLFCLEKLQWITYVILLCQIGIDDNALDDWMDRVMGVG